VLFMFLTVIYKDVFNDIDVCRMVTIADIEAMDIPSTAFIASLGQ